MLHSIIQVRPQDTFSAATFIEILNDGVDRVDDRPNKLNRRYKQGTNVTTTKKFWDSTEDYTNSAASRLTPFRLEFIYE